MHAKIVDVGVHLTPACLFVRLHCHADNIRGDLHRGPDRRDEKDDLHNAGQVDDVCHEPLHDILPKEGAEYRHPGTCHECKHVDLRALVQVVRQHSQVHGPGNGHNNGKRGTPGSNHSGDDGHDRGNQRDARFSEIQESGHVRNVLTPQT